MSDTKDFRDFMLWEQAAQDTIDFKKIYVDMTGDVKAGLLLSQIIYWRLPRKNRSLDDTRLTIEKQGRKWLAKADADWWGEVRLSKHEARAARLIIEERGLITCQTMRFYGNPTTHICINEEAFMEAFISTLAIPEEERNAGPSDTFRAKRTTIKKPGSKPTSGNRLPRERLAETTPAPGIEAEAGAEESDPEPTPEPQDGESRYYENHNNGIMETVITGLRKVEERDYENHNNGIMETVITLTESPPETPAESPSETPSESGGGHSFTETARAESQTEPQAAPVAVMEPPAPTTTDDASLSTSKAPAAERVHGQSLAGTPDGVIEDDLELTDEDAEMLFGGQDGNAEDLEQVPGAAAVGRAALSSLVGTASIPAPEELLAPITVDLLRAIPEAELLERPAAVPSDAIYKTIVGFVGGKKVIEEGILDGNTPSGGVSRRYWLRLTSDDLDLIRTTAQAEAKATKKSFLTLCILGMDRLIGAPKRVDKAGPSVLGQAYDSPQVQEQRAAELAVQTGSTWLGRKSGAAYLIEESNGKSVFVEGLGEYQLVKFHKLFQPAD